MDGGWKTFDSTGRQKVASRPTNVDAIPAAKAFGTTQSIATSTTTPLIFASESYDTDGIHDTVTNTSRLTCRTPGIYHVNANVGWDTNATGLRNCELTLNGTRIADSRIGSTAAGVIGQTVSITLALAVGDYMEVQVFQNSGGNLNVDSQLFPPSLQMTWLGTTRNVTADKAAFLAYRTAALSLTNNVNTSLAPDTLEFDSRGWFSTSTGRYTPQVAGWYHFEGHLNISGTVTGAGTALIGVMVKNGSTSYRVSRTPPVAASTANHGIGGSIVLEANGTTDYFEFHGFENDGGNLTVEVGNVNVNHFSGHLVQAKS